MRPPESRRSIRLASSASAALAEHLAVEVHGRVDAERHAPRRVHRARLALGMVEDERDRVGVRRVVLLVVGGDRPRTGSRSCSRIARRCGEVEARTSGQSHPRGSCGGAPTCTSGRAAARAGEPVVEAVAAERRSFETSRPASSDSSSSRVTTTSRSRGARHPGGRKRGPERRARDPRTTSHGRARSAARIPSYVHRCWPAASRTASSSPRPPPTAMRATSKTDTGCTSYAPVPGTRKTGTRRSPRRRC